MTSIRLTLEYIVYTFMPRVMLFASEEAGQDLIEYALVAALLALGAVATLKGVATKINAIYSSISTALTSAV